MDDTGAPLSGEDGPGAIRFVDALKARWSDAEGAAADAALAVGNIVAGVAGDAAWKLIASPLGVAALGFGLWLMMPRGGGTS
jgi:hypothetical protein